METSSRYAEWLEGFRSLLRQDERTQEEFGKAVGKSREYINSILCDRKKAGADLQDAICAALGFTYDQVRLFGRLGLAEKDRDKVAALAKIVRENRAPASLTDEEWNIVQELMRGPLIEMTALPVVLDGYAAARQGGRARFGGGSPAPPVEGAVPPRYVTVLRRVSAGEPRELCDEDVVGQVAVGSDIPAGAYAWQVSGDSMLRPDGRGIKDGDVVFFVEETRPAHNAVVLVNNEFGDTVLKRLKIKPGSDEYVLISDNPAYEPLIPNEQFRIVGVVVDVIRKPDWR